MLVGFGIYASSGLRYRVSITKVKVKNRRKKKKKKAKLKVFQENQVLDNIATYLKSVFV
jgi:hypothetical protein